MGPPPRASTPPLHCLRIFARMHVFAKSCFWYVLSQLMKMKKSSWEIVSSGPVFENPSPLSDKELWQLSVLRLPQHVPGGLGPDHRGCRRPVLQGHGGQHRACSHSIQLMWWRRCWPTSAAAHPQSISSMTPRSCAHCLAQSFTSSKTRLQDQEAQRILLDAGPPSPLVFPNKAFMKPTTTISICSLRLRESEIS